MPNALKNSRRASERYEKKDECPKVSMLKVLAFGLKVNIRTMPVFFIFSKIVAIVYGVSVGLLTFVSQNFYDSVIEVITDNQPISRVILAISALGAALICKHLLTALNNFMRLINDTKITGEMSKITHDKMARIDPVCLEDTKLHDDIEKVEQGARAVQSMVNISLTSFTFFLPYFIFMGFYLHYLKPQFVFAIVLVFVPVLLSQFVRTGIIAKFEDKAAPIKREYNYYNTVITGREYYKETRMLGGYSFFLEHFIKKMKNLSKAELRANRKINLLEFCTSLISATGYVGILYMLVTALLAGEITVGMFAAVFNSIDLMFGMMDRIINYHIGGMAANMGMAHNFIRFMELPERSGVGSKPVYEKGIIAENINFTYPYAKKKSVDDVSLEIKVGETIAIVGENGAGKTTLVRLLMGLYTPTEGKVTLNGMDTAKTSNQSIFNGLSGVFQKYQRYQMTLDENIKISDCGVARNIDVVAEQAGVDINGRSFPNGGNTMLSREFDGVDLSGGEWQRIAIARGLYRAHNVVVLDEPTAAIDPIEESHIYRKFVEISKDKTAIIVTHRLGSTKIANRVVVMDKGKIVEIGSHYELMQKEGLYAQMYISQAGWYMV